MADDGSASVTVFIVIFSNVLDISWPSHLMKVENLRSLLNSLRNMIASDEGYCWNECVLDTTFVMFVRDLRQVVGFLRVLRFPPPIKWH
jgi:hypothetical protein